MPSTEDTENLLRDINQVFQKASKSNTISSTGKKISKSFTTKGKKKYSHIRTTRWKPAWWQHKRFAEDLDMMTSGDLTFWEHNKGNIESVDILIGWVSKAITTREAGPITTSIKTLSLPTGVLPAANITQNWRNYQGRELLKVLYLSHRSCETSEVLELIQVWKHLTETQTREAHQIILETTVRPSPWPTYKTDSLLECQTGMNIQDKSTEEYGYCRQHGK